MRNPLLSAALLSVAAACAAPIPPAPAPAPSPQASVPATTSTATPMPTAAANTSADPDKVIADGGIKVPGWTGRLDPRAAASGRTLADTKFIGMGDGFHITAGPAATYWNPANTARGNYTVQATFTQTKASTHPEGYGVFMGGTNLEAPNQSYGYFLVRQDGKFLINHRASDTVIHKMVDWTAHPAIKAIDASGKATNSLAIVLDTDKVSFRVNGTEVHTLPRAVADPGGPNSGTAGIAGIRVNHNLDVHISGFAVTAAQ